GGLAQLLADRPGEIGQHARSQARPEGVEGGVLDAVRLGQTDHVHAGDLVGGEDLAQRPPGLVAALESRVRGGVGRRLDPALYRAASPNSSLTGLVRSVSTRVARPAPRASRAVSLTQCDSARPTTSTLVIWWAVRISPSVRPVSSRPSNPEYAAA